MPVLRRLLPRRLRADAAAITLALVVGVAPAWAQAGTAAPPDAQIAKVPMKGAGTFGSTLELHTEVFKPAGDGPFPVLVYAHGRSGTQQERSAMTEVVPRQFLNYWTEQGFAVVAPARPGYGKTGGSDREVPGHRWGPGGTCLGAPDPARVATVAAAATQAAVTWAREQPWAVRSKIVLAGNSVGGLATAALAATDPEGVVAYINFAGGVAGNPDQSPGKSCAPELVRDAFSRYGKTTRVPGLWLYAENDRFWGADVPKQWHAAFAEGSPGAVFVATPPVPNADGHELIFVGRDLWSAAVDRFLKDMGLR